MTNSGLLLTVLLGAGLALSGGCGGSGAASSGGATGVEALPTATPIKHVLIIVGENRSFDHLFATYVPGNADTRVLNLLSQGIVNADGTPGPNFAKARQYWISSVPNGGKYFSSVDLKDKTPYTTLPAPDLNGVGASPPAAFVLDLPGGDPGLPAQDQYLFGTGGSGLSSDFGPDTRITDVLSLPPGPFRLTGATFPYDSYAADTAHLFFSMLQQADCAIDAEHVSADNPTGCLQDLHSAVSTTYLTPPGSVAHDTGQTMEYMSMSAGDAPVFKALADAYTLSDNYHQPVMGSTGPNSQPLGFADLLFYSDGAGNAATPPAAAIFDPDPQPGTVNLYARPAYWFDCADETQPGIAARREYLRSLPYAVDAKCGTGQYWQGNNLQPAFSPKGARSVAVSVAPATAQRGIGDVLSAHNIPWKYYGGGFNDSGTHRPLDETYCALCNPFEFQAAYPQMVADHMRDVTDLFVDLVNGTLPAVAYVKPDGLMDGHPASSKWTLYEAFVNTIIQLAQSNPAQWASTAIFVTVDEGGGFYDSGFIQPVDFFGTGPRIPMIAVSPFSTGGHVSHVYSEHSSFVKFVERNWKLAQTLSSRSRDNLPNPLSNPQDPYVPDNMPAIGDLFDLFQFDGASAP